MKAGKSNTRFTGTISHINRVSHKGRRRSGNPPAVASASARRPWFRSLIAFALAAMAFSGAPTLRAQTTNEVEQLKRQMQQLEENFERVQRDQRQQIDALSKKLDDLTKQQDTEAEKKTLDVLDGAVDPYFKGFANIVLKLDQNGQTAVELEEAYLQSMSLPANRQLKAGQFLADFGRQNTQHPQQWAFVDNALILTRTFGPDGLWGILGQISCPDSPYVPVREA